MRSNGKGYPLSRSNLNPQVEADVIEAFKAIHDHDVVHGDVRPENVLVEEESGQVWIVDFEFARIITENGDSEFSTEMREVEDMLSGMKREHPCCGNAAAPRG